MSLTFSRPGQTDITLTPVSGSLQLGGGDDDRGGGSEPRVRAGVASNGKCKAIIDSAAFPLASAMSLVSPVGEGDFTVSGDASCSDAIIDVEISGDGVQVASISWKGRPS